MSIQGRLAAMKQVLEEKTKAMRAKMTQQKEEMLKSLEQSRSLSKDQTNTITHISSNSMGSIVCGGSISIGGNGPSVIRDGNSTVVTVDGRTVTLDKKYDKVEIINNDIYLDDELFDSNSAGLDPSENRKDGEPLPEPLPGVVREFIYVPVLLHISGDAGNIQTKTSVVVEGSAGNVDAGDSVYVGGGVRGNVIAQDDVVVGGGVGGYVDASDNAYVGGGVGAHVDAGDDVYVGGDVDGPIDGGDIAVHGNVMGNVDAGGDVRVGIAVRGSITEG